MSAPLAVFAYRRADHLRRLLDSVAAAGVGERDVHLFIDGPADGRAGADVARVHEFARSLRMANLHLHAREQNLGLAAAVVEGVSTLCREYGKVIVFEDDLVISSGAFRFFDFALERYEAQSQVWMVCGYIHDVPELRNKREALFLPFAHPWGWATWERAWHGFDLATGPDRLTLKSHEFRRRFNGNGANSVALLDLALAGKVNSWYVRWYYRMLMTGALSVFPPRRLVDNFGFGAGGTHASRLNPRELLLRRPAMNGAVPELPESIAIDYRAMDLIQRSWEARVDRFVAFGGRVKRQLRVA